MSAILAFDFPQILPLELGARRSPLMSTILPSLRRARMAQALKQPVQEVGIHDSPAPAWRFPFFIGVSPVNALKDRVVTTRSHHQVSEEIIPR